MRLRKRKTIGTKLHKVYAYLWDDMYDKLIEREKDILYTPGVAKKDPLSWRARFAVEKSGLWILCKIYGHEPERDQCGIPEHDFCGWCNRSMPNMYVPKD